jgi:hypothetical protein
MAENWGKFIGQPPHQMRRWYFFRHLRSPAEAAANFLGKHMEG